MGANREDAIRTLYGAAMGTGSWLKALDALADIVQCRVATLDTYDLNAHEGQVLAANVVPDSSIDAYNRQFGRGNFQIEAGAHQYRAGKVLRTSDFICQRELLRSDLYNNVYRPMGIRYGCGVALEVTGSRIVEFTFMRATDAGDHTDRDVRRIRRLTPHLRQAWAGYSHLSNLEASLSTLTGLWNRFDHAVIILDAQLKLRFANRAAEGLLTEGRYWRSRNGHLKSSDRTCQASLRSAVQDILGDRQGIYSLADSNRQSNGVTATLYRIDDERVALIVSDPNRSTDEFRAGLYHCFGLTSTEAELVNALLAGETLRQFAESRKVSYETARTHLKNAMAKNGWRRQSEMIASVLRCLLPPGMFREEWYKRPGAAKGNRADFLRRKNPRSAPVGGGMGESHFAMFFQTGPI